MRWMLIMEHSSLPTVGSCTHCNGDVSLNPSCFLWPTLGLRSPWVLLLLFLMRNLFTTWNLISLFASSDLWLQLWFWRETSPGLLPRGERGAVTAASPAPPSLLRLAFDRNHGAAAWAVRLLSSLHPSVQHTYWVFFSHCAAAIDVGQLGCVWKSVHGILWPDCVKWMWFRGQTNRLKAHTVKYEAASTNSQCVHLDLSLPLCSHTDAHWGTPVCTNQSQRQQNSIKDWTVCAVRKLLLHLSLAGCHQRRGWRRDVRASVGESGTKGGGNKPYREGQHLSLSTLTSRAQHWNWPGRRFGWDRRKFGNKFAWTCPVGLSLGAETWPEVQAVTQQIRRIYFESTGRGVLNVFIHRFHDAHVEQLNSLPLLVIQVFIISNLNSYNSQLPTEIWQPCLIYSTTNLLAEHMTFLICLRHQLRARFIH